MSAHYLIDLFATPLTSSPIVDVRYPLDGQTPVGGQFVVRVPDGVAINPPPTDLSDLITKKHLGLLAFYAGFTNIAFDDLLDSSGIDPVASTGILGGQRGSPTLSPLVAWSGPPVGIFQTVTVPLTGPAPSFIVPVWELWEAVDTDPSTDRFSRDYSELPATATYVTGEVSFDGGLTYTAATSGSVLFIPGPSQGTNFILRLTNVHASKRVRIGSWALVY